MLLGIVSFLDLNADQHLFQRRFTNEILRCDAIDSQLNSILTQLKKEDISVLELLQGNIPVPKYRELHQLEQIVERLTEELNTLEKNIDSIRQSYVHVTENFVVLKKINQIWNSLDQIEMLDTGEEVVVILPEQLEINSITGLIKADKMIALERILWRFFGRNIYIKVLSLNEPLMTEKEGFEYKKIFTIYYKGDNIHGKIRKICDAFKTQIFEFSKESSVRADQIKRLDQQICDLTLVLQKSKDYYFKVLRSCSVEIFKWRTQVIKFRAIFIALNKFNYDLARKCLLGELWCPNGNKSILQNVLNRFNQMNDYLAPTILDEIPRNLIKQTIPTYFRLNKFTEGFQTIVDSYGLADYQEMNPTPFTIITFPFLFAVMFGDAGHGFIMFLFGLWMVLYEKSLIARQIKDEIWQLFFGGRYIILLMGAFSIYTGLMYNDIFSKSINLFKSSFWSPNPNKNDTGQAWFDNTETELSPIGNYSGTPYPFGIDPIWQLSTNKILFLNSYKMKLSVILGVSQMAFGVVISLMNHIYFGRTINIVCEFIPQMIFLFNIFGYMNIQIFMKWFKYSASNANDAPSILINLINMFLNKYPDSGPKYLQPWYSGQKILQTFLLVSALICVPWILFPKVFYLRHKQKRGEYQYFENEEETQHGGQLSPASHNHEHDNESFGDAIIHQAIHTIEYCLGSISHTASYLRLWALSLAHSELSEVLWSMVLAPGIRVSSSNRYINGLMMCTVFSFWAFLSVAVLIVMEGLSAFLHALRLHWVEFQSKFYSGTGVKFEPFSFDIILKENELSW